ncbi:MAG: FGGY family carbohydrate kinase [Nitrospiria bacterium]
MRRREVLVAIDQGSGSSRVVAFDRAGRILASSRRSLASRTPHPGWVEHDPLALWRGVKAALTEVLSALGRNPVAVGLATQRSTVLIWERATGRPLSPAISWQDRRAADLCAAWSARAEDIRQATGLMLSPSYAAPKLRWLLDHLPGSTRRAEQGELLCGTINTFLIWHLSGGLRHVTDHTQAARMLLMNLATLDWDRRLCEEFGIPLAMLPTILPTVADYGTISLGSRTAPLLASIGDQQAAAIGQERSHPGDMCLHYGTGAFALLHTGPRIVRSPGLLTSLGWSTAVARSYLLEGGVNAVGSGLAWIQRHWRVPRDLAVLDQLAQTSTAPVTFLPALAGLAAPDWDPMAGGIVGGLTLATDPRDIVRGFLEGTAYLVARIVETMPKADGVLRASGGLASLDVLMQSQADLLGRPIYRTKERETSAWGAALLAGVGAGLWPTPGDVNRRNAYDRRFLPQGNASHWTRKRWEWDSLIQAARGLGSYTGVNHSS